MFTPDGDVFEVSYEVAYGDAHLTIDLVPPADVGESIMALDPMLEAGTLVFTLEIGEGVSCSLLAQDDGHYEGECVDSSGEGALMTMFPPDGGR